MNGQKISVKYVLVVFFAVGFTWITHEFAHWVTSEMLGYDAIMTLNGVRPVEDGDIASVWHATIISASGPVITILQGIGAFFLLKSGDWNKYLYPLLFVAFYMRFVAAQMNLINLNDEGRISAFFGLGFLTLPILVCGLLFFLVYKISRQHSLKWKFQLATTLLVMVFSSVLILADQMFGIRLL